MGRKLCLPSLFFFRGGRNSSRTQSSWGWPSCHHPKTHSFRAVATATSDNVYKTVNSVYFDSPESRLTFTKEETESFSTTSDSGEFAGEGYASVEALLIRRLRSDRLLFETKEASSSSIMEEYIASTGVPFKQSIVMAMESEDPCCDFKVSMEEMVAAHGLDEWERLLQLLVWYLKANMKETHGFIFRAFLDLIADLGASAAASSSSSLDSVSFDIQELQFTSVT
ncbi:hypothetical protein KSP40_PGU016214 [Platanthera guangdongensis]|uniref:Transcription repressor n=1 Tax=Platanthera guangdongensis TaxID=2320717 RepID=A0ABR2M5J4_9ASPA